MKTCFNVVPFLIDTFQFFTANITVLEIARRADDECMHEGNKKIDRFIQN